MVADENSLPYRPSKDVTENYLQGRKDYMRAQNIAHHDLIYAYDQIYRQKLDSSREWLLQKERSTCTFKPVISTRPSARRYWEKRANARLNTSIESIHGDEESISEGMNKQNISLESVSDGSFQTHDSFATNDYKDGKQQRKENLSRVISSSNMSDHNDSSKGGDGDESQDSIHQRQQLQRQPSYSERYLRNKPQVDTQTPENETIGQV